MLLLLAAAELSCKMVKLSDILNIIIIIIIIIIITKIKKKIPLVKLHG
jgi:hypothetical protein